MAQSITLEIPDDIITYAQQIADENQTTLEAVLTIWIVREAQNLNPTMLIAGETYAIYTPLIDDAGVQNAEAVLKAMLETQSTLLERV